MISRARPMNRDECLQRWREQYRARRAAETNQQTDKGLARRREYDRSRRAALSREQRHTINDVRRVQRQATPPIVPNIDLKNCTTE